MKIYFIGEISDRVRESKQNEKDVGQWGQFLTGSILRAGMRESRGGRQVGAGGASRGRSQLLCAEARAHQQGVLWNQPSPQ